MIHTVHCAGQLWLIHYKKFWATGDDRVNSKKIHDVAEKLFNELYHIPSGRDKDSYREGYATALESFALELTHDPKSVPADVVAVVLGVGE